MKIFSMFLLLAGLATSAPAQYGGNFPRQEGRFGISVKAGPAFPTAEFADLFKTGYTGFVEVPYNLAEGLQIYVGLGLSRFNIDNSKLASQMGGQAGSLTTTVDAPYQLVPVMLGVNFSYRYEHFWPYFALSFSRYFEKLETSGSYTLSGVTTTLESKTQTWAQNAFGIGIGSLIPLGNEGWAIDVNAKFNAVVDYDARVLITSTGGNEVSIPVIRFVSVLAGLSYTF